MLSSQASRILSSLAVSGVGATSLRGLAASFSFSSSSSIAAAAAAAADAAPSTSSSTPSTRVGAHAPRVQAVSMSLVLPNGARVPLRALPGQTLASVLLDHSSELPETHPATEGERGHGVSPVAFSPEGRGAAEAVIEVPADVAAAFPAPGKGTDEARALEELAEEVKSNSRLASSVVVSEGLEGATIALAKLRPWATL